MIWNHIHLDKTVLKTKDEVSLWRTERGIVEVTKDTLAIPVNSGDKRRGYVFHGKGKLLLDAIVETEEGAIGKSVEKALDEPFLVLGNAEDTAQHLVSADEKDLKNVGYGNLDEFASKAEGLLEKFANGRRMHFGHCSTPSYGLFFAFPNKAGRLDFLAVKDLKVFYKAADMMFMSNGRKALLKSPEHVILAHHSGLCIIDH
ncbi:hypothetical protein KEJ15_05480 [Candidatus Bathyarchaeota archaeon]|nr:hypothetical protein [Candidatus Bathyarchaeota archaeon]